MSLPDEFWGGSCGNRHQTCPEMGLSKEKHSPLSGGDHRCFRKFPWPDISIISFSTESLYRDDFGPLLRVLYGSPMEMRMQWKKRSIPIPLPFSLNRFRGKEASSFPRRVFKEIRKMCTENNVLFIADEIQTGLGATVNSSPVITKRSVRTWSSSVKP